MVSPISEADDALKERDMRIRKMQDQLKSANRILLGWDEYGDEFGCSSNKMNELFEKTDTYIRKYIL